MQVTFKNVTKKYDDVTAVSNFSAKITDGQLVCLLGPSGCGKSTLLNMLCGICPVTEGQIFFDDRDVTKLPIDMRNVGMVFQNYALYPHMTVLDNICFPLEAKKIPKKERQAKAIEIARLVHVDTLLKRYPGELSGGQQQRVAIARALVKSPDLLLMDEPLSNLDARLRIEMREEIKRIQTETKVTTIFVTHDQEEALSISDEIFLMKDALLVQKGVGQELYKNPINKFVADFLGTPPINQIEGEGRSDLIKALLENSGIEVPPVTLDKQVLEVRAESFILTTASEISPVAINTAIVNANIQQVYEMGKERIAIAKLVLPGDENQWVVVRIILTGDENISVGDVRQVTLKKSGVFLFNKASGEKIL